MTFDITTAISRQGFCPDCSTRLQVDKHPPWSCPLCGREVRKGQEARIDDEAHIERGAN